MPISKQDILNLCGLAACAISLEAFAQPATSASDSTYSSRPVSDEFSWLEPSESPKAKAWAREQTSRTVAFLTALPAYDYYYRTAVDLYTLNLSANVIPIDTTIVGDFIYRTSRKPSLSLGRFERASVSSWLRKQPAWTEVADIDSLAKDTWPRLGLKLFSQNCFSPTGPCSLFLSDSDEWKQRLTEFDVGSGKIVGDGLVVPKTRGGVVLWRDKDTALVAADFGAGTLGDAGSRNSLRVWQRRSKKFADEPLYVAEKKDGLLSPISGAFGHDQVIGDCHRDTECRLVLLTGGPRKTVVIGKMIAKVDGGFVLIASDGTSPSKPIPNGSLLFISQENIEHAVPQFEILSNGSAGYAFGPVPTQKGLIFQRQENGEAKHYYYAHRESSQWKVRPMELPVKGEQYLVGVYRDIAVMSVESMTLPKTLFAVNLSKMKTAVIEAEDSRFDTKNLVTEELEARSDDGTMVPYVIVRPRSVPKTGGVPTILNAYGALGGDPPLLYTGGTNQEAFFPGAIGKLWLERGGAFAVARVRGGGLGRSKGEGAARARTYEDFAAVARDLIERGLTSPKHLGIYGHSNGGLLMGVAINQHPELYNAAILENGFLDILRPDLTYGGGNDPTEGGTYGNDDVIKRTSPFQNLARRSRFPTPLITTATNDPDVFPGLPRRYAAKMESLGLPFFFYEVPTGSHGSSASASPEDRARRDALFLSYFSHYLGLENKN